MLLAAAPAGQAISVWPPRTWRSTLAAPLLLAGVLGGIGCHAARAAEPASAVTNPSTPQPSVPATAPPSIRLTGRVVWLDEALQRLHGVTTDADSAKTQTALETDAGQLRPLVREFRGRAFWKDPRLRDVPLELMVREFPGTDFVQVIRVYLWHENVKCEFDYWCDICAIPMYEPKACDCCQGEIRMRLRRVEGERTLDEELP